MFTTTVPGALYVLMLAVAPHLQAPPPDPFLAAPSPPEFATERSAALAPFTNKTLPQWGSRHLG